MRAAALALALVLAGCAGLAPPPLTCDPPLVKRTRVVAQRVPVNQGRQVVVIERKYWVEECVPDQPARSSAATIASTS